MKARTETGATLALVGAIVIIIVVIAVGLYLVTSTLGGGRELKHAVDSGTLNVAKRSLISPNLLLNMNNQNQAALAGLADTAGPGNYKVNLRNFNRLVGQSLLVALNADAENQFTDTANIPPYDPATNVFTMPPLATSSGGPYGFTGSGVITDTQTQAVANATAVVGTVEGATSSLGQRLRALLTPATNTWAGEDFNAIALGNSVRMLNSTNQISWQAGDFVALWDAQPEAGVASQTNISIPNPTVVNGTRFSYIPFTDYSAATADVVPATMLATDGAWSASPFVSGYVPIAVPSQGATTIMGVPLEVQTHLISLREDTPAHRTQPSSGAVAVPPNAFVNGATSVDKKVNHTVHLISAAIDGPLQSYPLSMPYGYITIDNSATHSAMYQIPYIENCFANQLGSGIVVDTSSGFFSNETPNAVLAYENWNRAPGTSPPPVDGLFDNTGKAVTDPAMAAAKIPYNPNGSVVCTNANSSTDVPGSPQACLNLVRNVPADACDYAYNPNLLGNPTGNMFSGKPLTAGEHASASGINAYYTFLLGYGYHNSSGTGYSAGTGYMVLPGQLFGSAVISTGMRVYPPSPDSPIPPNPPADGGYNSNLPQQAHWNYSPATYIFQGPQSTTSYSQPYPCRITTNGTLEELCTQTHPKAQTAVTNFIRQRMEQILPGGSSQYATVVQDTQFPLETKVYVYIRPDANNLPTTNVFTVSTTPPPWLTTFGVSQRPADGKLHWYSNTFGAMQTLGNPKGQAGLQRNPFLSLYLADGSCPNNCMINQIGTTVDSQYNNQLLLTDQVSFRPGSGANLNLGDIIFTEFAKSNTGSGRVLGTNPG